MPHEIMDEQQVAAYLHMDVRDLAKLASQGRIPCRKIQGKHRFRKGDIDHWIEERMHTLGKERLAGIERGVSAHHGMEADGMIVCPLIPQGGLAAPLNARTRDAAIRALADLADKAGMVYARDELVKEVRNREKLCSTAMMPGVAMPHPRHPLPYDIAGSFVTVGLTSSGIAFGAADGSLTRLFFLICCKDDRTHLHVLARLAQMLHEPDAMDELLLAGGADELGDILSRREQAVLHKRT